MRATEAIFNTAWAIEPGALDTIIAIAARDNDVGPEALEAYRAKSLENAVQATVREGVAIISANGPLFRRANMFTAISGATSYDIMRRDLQAAVDKKLKGAILNLDTPGGEVNGASELATYLASLRGTFPVVAYVGGQAASAGYWLASAADEIVIDPTALLGSIGVQMAVRKTGEAEGTTTFQFVSSQSPMKNSDPGSKEGSAALQGIVDALAEVFVGQVAANRGVSVETVLSKFGKGAVFVGEQAITAGLADRLGTFEGVLAELSAGKTTTRGSTSHGTSSPGATHAPTAAALRPKLQAIVDHALAKGAAPVPSPVSAEDLAAQIIESACIAEGKLPAARINHRAALAAPISQLSSPPPLLGSSDPVEAAAAAILAAAAAAGV